MNSSEFNKLSAKEQRKVPFKEQPTSYKIMTGIVLLFMIIIPFTCIRSGCNDDAKAKESLNIDWDKASYEQRAEWIKKRINNPDDDGYAFITQMQNAIKKEFNYPEEVDFDMGYLPILDKGDIVDADNGKVFYRGTGTAKNAFGVKSKFVYSLRAIIKPGIYQIEEVSVTEAN